MKWSAIIVGIVCLAAQGAARGDLTADNLLLIANKNSAVSIHLAQVYATERGVDPSRIVMVDVPDAEEMDFEAYQSQVRFPVRLFLIEHKLAQKVTCLVTFYGVPFRVLAKKDTAVEAAELVDIRKQFNHTLDVVEPGVAEAEKLAESVDASFHPVVRPSDVDDVPTLLQRCHVAFEITGRGIGKEADSPARRDQVAQLANLVEKLGGNSEIVALFGRAQLSNPNVSPDVVQRWTGLLKQAILGQQARNELQMRPFDARARAALRHLAEVEFGQLGLMAALQEQIFYLTPDKVAGATDSDLAMLWWSIYVHHSPQTNPLNYQVAAGGDGDRTAPVLMVSRLDGPDGPTVEDMIHTSIVVEKTGLKGCVAIDSRGLGLVDSDGKPSAFGEFDEKLRNLAGLVRQKTTLELHHEDTDRLFYPGEVSGGALYCGWYSVRHYIPGVKFNPGAVGFHISSYELVALHDEHEQGWVHGLVRDGVVATVGSVAEPYLWAFPPPDEFFPLLMTGKLSLAEVYWKTEPTMGWEMCLIGDPLYRPYQADPAMRVEDLPGGLRGIFVNRAPVTRP